MLPDWFRQLPREAPLAVVCLTSHRSPIAAQQLRRLGFRQVINVDGGMMAWRQEDLPVVTGANPAA
jgi:rhodanese-related sulfurtransferase